MPYSPPWTDDEKRYFWEELIPTAFDDSDPPKKILFWANIAHKMTKKFPSGRTYTARSVAVRYRDTKDALRSGDEGKALAKKVVESLPVQLVVESLPGKKVVESLQGEDSGATKEQQCHAGSGVRRKPLPESRPRGQGR